MQILYRKKDITIEQCDIEMANKDTTKDSRIKLLGKK